MLLHAHNDCISIIIMLFRGSLINRENRENWTLRKFPAIRYYKAFLWIFIVRLLLITVYWYTVSFLKFCSQQFSPGMSLFHKWA